MTDAAAILNQISETLAEAPPTMEETVRLVSRATASAFASACVLWLAGDDERLEMAAAYDPGPAATPGEPGWLGGWSEPLHAAVFEGQPRTAAPFTVTRPTSKEPAGTATARQSAAAACGPGQEDDLLTAVALKVGGVVTGVLGVLRPASLGDLGDLEVALLRQIGDRAALALDNLALRAAGELETSRRHRAECAETAIRAQAVRDPLTGLPNRFLLADHNVGSAAPPGAFPPLSGAERTVLVIDIDRFKEINDTLGHAIGDLVLLEVSRRLADFGDPVELVARLGSDEFALVAERTGSPEGDERVARRLLSLLGEPFDVGGVKLRLRASIGIAPGDIDSAGNPLDVPVLLRRAESAMYQAKNERTGVRRYSDDLERRSVLRITLASELAEAIDHGQLQLDYQPKVSTADGSVTGVEALVRWEHPTRGLMLPDLFVPLAEQTGIIRDLTNWVLARALAECASWRRAGFVVPVAVNLSAGTVQDATLVETVTTALLRAGLPTEAIELEITESAVMGDPVGALRTLEELVAEGVRFSLDDFGTGYSSLSYLQRLPVVSVKIDKSFVSPLGDPDNAVALAIVSAVVELGHCLGLEVIAEGVESGPVLEAVTSMGCDTVQGFHIATPMASHDLRSWIASHRAGTPLPARPGHAAAR